MRPEQLIVVIFMIKAIIIFIGIGTLHLSACSEQENEVENLFPKAQANLTWQEWVASLNGHPPLKSEVPKNLHLVFEAEKYKKIRIPIPSDQIRRVKECQNVANCKEEPAISDIPRTQLKRIIVSPPYLYLKNENGKVLHKWIVENPEKNFE